MTTDPIPSAQPVDPATARFLPFEVVATNWLCIADEWQTRFRFDLDEDGLRITWSCSGPDGGYTNEWLIDSDLDSAWRDAIEFASCLTDPEFINLEGLERLDINGWKSWRSEAITLALMRDDCTSVGEDLLSLTESQLEQIYAETDSLFGTDRTRGLGATIEWWQSLRRREEIDDISFGALLTKYGYGDRFVSIERLVEHASDVYCDRSEEDAKKRIN